MKPTTKPIRFDRLNGKHAVLLVELLERQARKPGRPYSGMAARGMLDHLARMYPEVVEHESDKDPFAGL